MRTFFVVGLTLSTLALAAPLRADDQVKERRLSREEYRDKMKAGWIGQMAGVGVGGPTEFRWQEATVPADRVPAWKPETINQFDQDDIYVEMTFLRTLQKYGLDATSRQAGIDFANSKYPLWHANAAGRKRLREGIAPPDSGHPAFNDHADDIDYQIEADFSGLIAPGLPNTVIRLGETFGRLMNYGDGLYGGWFVGAMYSEAFFETDPEKIVLAGLAAIPKGCQYHECVSDVIAWHRENPKDWEATWKKIEAKYQKDRAYRRFSCSKAEKEPYKFNIDAKLNGAYIVMGLLYGEGDPEKTIVVSTRCGQDSDCNPSNAAGVLFTSIGAAKLPAKYTSALDTHTKFNSTDYAFPDVLAVCDDLAAQAVARAGGRVEKSADGAETFVIPVEAARPGPLESCWEPAAKADSRFTAAEKAKITETDK
ncbi:ADP-ribosylglycohydrolase family protein [Paludisphaera mucosa]|uniref:ADP-ribosylglycohydrolase family protein n=1 Tax=Paludisphaera mucosa TaxID=3030827 RepID=A0ABT6FAR7_9BACT|nr:ADP-ribosylglycohydrolase family protein [Paludisphaera mucosa]MDG3004622.1 ADP-ribosylglycohydrolase family protein [Paludisphaera mucosa]